MTTHQQRSVAFVLAALSIVLSLFLWAGIARSLITPVADVGSETFPFPSPTSSTGSVRESPAQSDRMPALQQRTAPLMPPLHFAGSAASRAADQQKRDELTQWEIREMATLSIPSLSVRSPVTLPSRRHWDARDWKTLERQMQVGLIYGVVAYPNAVPIGERGTIVIAGHSSPPNDRARESHFGSLFASLPGIEVGAQIILRTERDTAIYTVTETKIVPADDTTILLGQEEESLLKLITCFPVGSTKERFVAIAKQVEI